MKFTRTVCSPRISCLEPLLTRAGDIFLFNEIAGKWKFLIFIVYFLAEVLHSFFGNIVVYHICVLMQIFQVAKEVYHQKIVFIFIEIHDGPQTLKKGEPIYT